MIKNVKLDNAAKTEDQSYAKELGARISVVADAVGDRKSAALAAGISSDSLQRYIRGEVQPSLLAISKLCLAANYSLDWVSTGKGLAHKGNDTPNGYHVESQTNKAASPDSSEYCYLPLYDAYASAGRGALNDNEQVIDKLAFKQSWLRTEMGLSPENCCLIQVIGDSMEPTLHKRDVVMIDCSYTNIIEDGIYCLRLDNGLLIKRIQRLMGRKLKVISDNPAYETFTIDDFDTEGQGVIGRVIWVGKRF